MSVTHQMYCTHCTFGTSALERRKGDMETRPLGYNVRAASFAGEELRKRFRDVERYLYYYLPSDTPGEKKTVLDAATAPRRFTYFPAIGDLQILGQMSYRQFDTANRPGSYFGHFISTPRNDPAWKILDTFRLWGAAWRAAAEDNEPFDLPKFEGPEYLARLLNGRPQAIDEALLLQFLDLQPGGAWKDPANVVTDRWRKKSVEVRRALFTDVLGGYLDLTNPQRESILVAIEPSVAALLFYGVARLLPPGDLREQISYSTYEPTPERLPVSLAATTFFDEEKGRLRPEQLRGRNLVLDTFGDGRGGQKRPPGDYPKLVVGTLLKDGWTAVDKLLDSFAAVQSRRSDDLEALARQAQANGLIDRLFDPASTADKLAMPQNQVALAFVENAVRSRAAGANASALLTPLAGKPAQLALLKLLATDASNAAAAPACHTLLASLQAGTLPELLAADRIAFDYKVEGIVKYIGWAGRLPDNCPMLWQDAPRGVGGAPPPRPLLPAVLAGLEPDQFDKVVQYLPAARRPAFEQVVFAAAQLGPPGMYGLRSILKQLDADALCDFLTRHEAILRRIFSNRESSIAERFTQLLDAFPFAPPGWTKHVAILEKWSAYLAEPGIMEPRVRKWKNVLVIAQKIRGGPSSGRHAHELTDDLVKALADGFTSAMNSTGAFADLSTSERVDRLRKLVEHAHGRNDLVAEGYWVKIAEYLETGVWSKTIVAEPRNKELEFTSQPSAPSGAMQGSTQKSRKSRRRVPVWVLVLGAAMVLGGGIGAALRLSKHGDVVAKAPAVKVAANPDKSATEPGAKKASANGSATSTAEGSKAGGGPAPKTDPKGPPSADPTQVASATPTPTVKGIGEIVKQIEGLQKSYEELIHEVNGEASAKDGGLRSSYEPFLNAKTIWKKLSDDSTAELIKAEADLKVGYLDETPIYDGFALKMSKIDDFFKQQKPKADNIRKPKDVLEDAKKYYGEVSAAHTSLKAFPETQPGRHETDVNAEALTKKFETLIADLKDLAACDDPEYADGLRTFAADVEKPVDIAHARFSTALLQPEHLKASDPQQGGASQKIPVPKDEALKEVPFHLHFRGKVFDPTESSHFACAEGDKSGEWVITQVLKGSAGQKDGNALRIAKLSKDADGNLSFSWGPDPPSQNPSAVKWQELWASLVEIVVPSEHRSKFYALYGRVDQNSLAFDDKGKATLTLPASCDKLGLKLGSGAICGGTVRKSFTFFSDGDQLLGSKPVTHSLGTNWNDIFGEGGAFIEIKQTKATVTFSVEFPKQQEDGANVSKISAGQAQKAQIDKIVKAQEAVRDSPDFKTGCQRASELAALVGVPFAKPNNDGALTVTINGLKIAANTKKQELRDEMLRLEAEQKKNGKVRMEEQARALSKLKGLQLAVSLFYDAPREGAQSVRVGFFATAPCLPDATGTANVPSTTNR